MKKRFQFLLSIGLVLFFFRSAGQQITITENSQIPSSGDTVHFIDLSPSGFDSVGTGPPNAKVWDNSGLAPTGSTYDYYYIDTASVLPGFGLSNFPNATLARAESGSPGYFYYNNSMNDINRLGWYISASNFSVYTGGTMATDFHFPISYGQTFVSNYHGYFAPLNLGEDSVTIDLGQVEIEADRQGELLIPTAYFDNVLRLHVKETFHLRAWLSGLAVYDETILDDYFYWYVDSIFQPVLIAGKTYDNGSVQASVLRYQPIPLFNRIESSTSVEPALFPNPGQGRYVIKNMSEFKSIKIEVYNCRGELIHEIVPENSNTHVIEISGEPAGVYYVRVYTEKRIFSKKLILD